MSTMKRRPPRLSSTEAGALTVEREVSAEVEEATDGAQMPVAPPDGRERVAMDGRVNLGN